MASDSGITSIVLRSSRKLSYESVLAVLDELFPDAYDFLYLPWPKLAIVNFTTPELCRLAWGILDNSRHGDVDIRYVKEAHHQGLAQNLALFCAKEGWENKEAGAPKVFVSGREISIDEAMEQFVSVEMLQNFQALRSNIEPAREREETHIIQVNRELTQSQIPKTGNIIFRF
ncbi:SEC14 cytosolic factor [Durusdinium trenchii]|uniref:SEC14 cytosolic factor n=1 Tax=Durusdinium trenchii TaxID=1381693 RepID=A0ABP0KC40_9DINO